MCKDKKELVNVVWRMLIKNTAYTPDSWLAQNVKKAMFKLSKSEIDSIGCILLTKRNEV